MSYGTYRLIGIERRGEIVIGTIDNPPINLMTRDLFAELSQLAKDVEADPGALVFIMRSANPDFFIAHFDVEAIIAFPTDQPPSREAASRNSFHAMCERFRTMNKATIAQIEGRVGGGGSELAMSFDMRFGVTGKSIVNQMEVPIGIIPGGSGTQRMPRLIGRNRALEVILGGIDLDAETGERWGYFNRIFAANEIGPYVDALAARIASFPPEAVRRAKEAVNASERPLAEGLQEEGYLFQLLLRTEEAKRNMPKFLAAGGQTREGEMNIAELSASVAKPE